MQNRLEILRRDTFRFIRDLPFACLLSVGLIGCSSGEAIEIPIGPKKFAVDNQNRISQSKAVQTKTSAELSESVLSLLSALPTNDIGSIHSSDFISSQSLTSCGFLAAEPDISETILQDAQNMEWLVKPGGKFLIKKSPTSVITFRDCRCLIETISAQNQVYLVPFQQR